MTAIKGIWWELQRVAAQPSCSGSTAVEEHAQRLSGAAAELAACMSRWEQAAAAAPEAAAAAPESRGLAPS